MAEADRVIGVVLLCAHPRNALYVEIGLLCAHYVDQKWAVWRLFWANFAVVGAMKFPFCVVSAREGLEMLDMGYARVCWCCSESFCFVGPRFSAFGTFCRKHGAFMWVYVAVSAGFFYVFLCGPPY